MRNFIVILICWWAVVFNANAESVTCQHRHCLAVVDAGSSGSRLHIYSYDLDSNNTPIKINELWSKKIRPGFSTIEPNQDTIDAYLGSLFANSPEQNMPVYFYATAGMRLLPQPKQQVYYQALQKWFAKESEWQLIDSKTITGSEEGVLGWLAINYQLGRFETADKSLVSVMDMGGASVQITFPVHDVAKINPNDLVSVDISGRHLELFVHSFLGLGQTVLSQQFLDRESCFALGYLLPSGQLGQGDASTCQHNVSQLINHVHGVSGIVQPAIASNTAHVWYAMGGVASIAEDKPFSFTNNQFTNKNLLQQADNDVCHQQWQYLQSQYAQNEYLYGYCLFPAYYYALMVDGYGLQPDQLINYMPSGQVADWSLGVVLRQH